MSIENSEKLYNTKDSSHNVFL